MVENENKRKLREGSSGNDASISVNIKQKASGKLTLRRFSPLCKCIQICLFCVSIIVN